MIQLDQARREGGAVGQATEAVMLQTWRDFADGSK